MHNNQLTIYTDGSSRGNPGPGGYGTILIWKGTEKELSAGFRYTTNNRMELMAVIAGLEALTKNNLSIIIYSDSQYLSHLALDVLPQVLDRFLRAHLNGDSQ